MLTPTLIAAFFCSPSVLRQQEREGAHLFLRAIPEVSALMNGEALEFRNRQFDFAEQGPAVVPELAIEGVTRLEYRDTGVFTNELYLERASQAASLGACYHVRTFHSFLTGEYARASRLAGGVETVFIERWRGLPKLTYLALGLLGPPNGLQGGEFLGLRTHADGLREAEYLIADKTLTLLFQDTPSPRLLRAESRAPNDAWTAVRYFEDHVPGMGGLPDRPMRIVEAKVANTGHIQSVTVWQAIQRLDEPQIDDDMVAKSATVSCFRHSGDRCLESTTDRPMRLEELLTSYAGPVMTKPVAQVDVGQFDSSGATEGSANNSPAVLPRIGFMLAIGLIGTAFALVTRRRSTESC